MMEPIKQNLVNALKQLTGDLAMLAHLALIGMGMGFGFALGVALFLTIVKGQA